MSGRACPVCLAAPASLTDIVGLCLDRALACCVGRKEGAIRYGCIIQMGISNVQTLCAAQTSPRGCGTIPQNHPWAEQSADKQPPRAQKPSSPQQTSQHSQHTETIGWQLVLVSSIHSQLPRTT
jgi:hypothetical protein